MVTKLIRERPARIYYIDLNFTHVKSKERRTYTNSFISKIWKKQKALKYKHFRAFLLFSFNYLFTLAVHILPS